MKALERAAQDPERPVYHFRPPARWMRDSNGTSHYRGRHHLFHQLNPFGAEWNHMYRGHARNRDLVNWEHLPIALRPSKEKGEAHVFSGGAAFGPDGRPRLFYTGIGRRDLEQWMALAEDEDLVRRRKYEHSAVLTLAAHGGLRVAEWRDPFLFAAGGATSMVCGGNLRERGGAAAVQLYEAADAELSRWRHRGVVSDYRRQDVYNSECPNLFPRDGRWMLLVSPHRQCEYFIVSLDLQRARFEPLSPGTLDAGDAYASNMSPDADGRVILRPWGRAGAGVAVTYDPAGATRVFLGRDSRVALRILLDKRVLEVYANDGECALFTTVDARPEDIAAEAFAEGGQARLLELTGPADAAGPVQTRAVSRLGAHRAGGPPRGDCRRSDGRL